MLKVSGGIDKDPPSEEKQMYFDRIEKVVVQELDAEKEDRKGDQCFALKALGIVITGLVVLAMINKIHRR